MNIAITTFLLHYRFHIMLIVINTVNS